MSSPIIDTDHLAEYLKGMGNPLRFRIIYALSRRGAMSVTELTDYLNANGPQEAKRDRSTVSCAISILYKEGIVRREQSWKTHIYSANIDLLHDISVTLQTLIYHT